MTLENLEKVPFLENPWKNFKELVDSGTTFYMHKIHLSLKYVLPVIFLGNHMKFSKLNESMYMITI